MPERRAELRAAILQGRVASVQELLALEPGWDLTEEFYGKTWLQRADDAPESDGKRAVQEFVYSKVGPPPSPPTSPEGPFPCSPQIPKGPFLPARLGHALPGTGRGVIQGVPRRASRLRPGSPALTCLPPASLPPSPPPLPHLFLPHPVLRQPARTAGGAGAGGGGGAQQ